MDTFMKWVGYVKSALDFLVSLFERVSKVVEAWPKTATGTMSPLSMYGLYELIRGLF